MAPRTKLQRSQRRVSPEDTRPAESSSPAQQNDRGPRPDAVQKAGPSRPKIIHPQLNPEYHLAPKFPEVATRKQIEEKSLLKHFTSDQLIDVGPLTRIRVYKGDADDSKNSGNNYLFSVGQTLNHQILPNTIDRTKSMGSRAFEATRKAPEPRIVEKPDSEVVVTHVTLASIKQRMPVQKTRKDILLAQKVRGEVQEWSANMNGIPPYIDINELAPKKSTKKIFGKRFG